MFNLYFVATFIKSKIFCLTLKLNIMKFSIMSSLKRLDDALQDTRLIKY